MSFDNIFQLTMCSIVFVFWHLQVAKFITTFLKSASLHNCKRATSFLHESQAKLRKLRFASF